MPKTSKRVQEAQARRQALLDEMKLVTFPVSEEAYYRFVNPDSENDHDQFIRRYLLSDEQRRELFERNLTVLDILNGRFTGEHKSFVYALFDVWNAMLGKKHFGF